MKKILIMLCCLIMCVSFSGCSGSANKTDVEIVNRCGRDFLLIDTPNNGCVYVDVETKVQYITFGGGNTARVAVLVDSDGKPILYEGDIFK